MSTVGRDGRIDHLEYFDEDDFDAALACLDAARRVELTGYIPAGGERRLGDRAALHRPPERGGLRGRARGRCRRLRPPGPPPRGVGTARRRARRVDRSRNGLVRRRLRRADAGAARGAGRPLRDGPPLLPSRRRAGGRLSRGLRDGRTREDRGGCPPRRGRPRRGPRRARRAVPRRGGRRAPRGAGGRAGVDRGEPEPGRRRAARHHGHRTSSASTTSRSGSARSTGRVCLRPRSSGSSCRPTTS